MPIDPRSRTVAAGFDSIVDRYLAWSAPGDGDPRPTWLERFGAIVPRGGVVVELGCGAAPLGTRWLAERYELTGVDVSERQLERARATLPDVRFIQSDMTAVDFPAGSIDGVVAMYAISHVPRDAHSALFGRIARWLRPGGSFVATLGAGDDPGWTGEWLGVQMFFSSFDAATNLRLLRDARLEPIESEIVTTSTPDGEETFLWVLARRA
jgi:ubiquinone/menaquinone biosynthesis C-methylase UbiE